jgi:hypothetical protein
MRATRVIFTLFLALPLLGLVWLFYVGCSRQ